MSGLEVLGALAAASQFADQSIKIISFISDLYRTVQDAPESIRKQVVQVQQLLDIARLIEDNAPLQNDTVASVLNDCRQEAEKLLNTLRKLSVASKDGTAKKVWKVMDGITKEKKILAHLGKLEQQKSSLTLCIATIDSALLPKIHLDLVNVKTSIDGFSRELQRLAKERVSKSSEHLEAHTKKYYRVPNRRVRGFIGREDILEEIDHGLSSGLAPRIVVLRGMGGQGKTQIALEYCHRAKNKLSAIFWVDATSEGSLKKSFEVISEDIKPATITLPDTDRRIDFVLESLSAWPSQWLIVFDNHDDPSAFNNFRDFLPSGENGLILITTRHADVDALGQGGRAIELPGLQDKDALELLFSQSGTKESDRDITCGESIVKRLGYHPLAITQAGAYINKRKIALKEFMDHYNRRRKLILEQTPQMSQYRRKLTDVGKETSLSVFTTWELSFQQLETMQTEGVKKASLLTLFAFFNSKDISERLFREFCTDRDSIDELPSCLNFLVDNSRWDSDQFLDILSELRDLSLLQDFTEETDGFQHFSLHPLVKDWVRLRTDKGTCQEYSLLATKVLAKIIIPYRRNYKLEMSLLAKQEALSHLDIHEENYHDFLTIDLVTSFEKSQLIDFADSEYWFQFLYNDTGRYKEAEVVSRRLIKLRNMVLGPEHPDTLMSISDLALIHDRQGKYEEAEGINRRVIKLRNTVLRPEHPDTLTSMSDLAWVLNMQGKYGEAESINQSVIKLRNMVLGPEHPSTLASMNNLAVVLDNQGKYEEAEGINQRVIELHNKVIGPEHPDTLISMSNLALVLNNQGKYEEAESINQQVIKLRNKVLGPEHPDTLISMSNLALVLDNQGKYEEAKSMNLRVIELRNKVLGLEHPETLASMHNLALVLNNQGKHEEAKGMNLRVIELRNKALGLEHPETLASMHNLALVLNNQGKHEEAKGMNLRVIELRNKVLGLEHPETLRSMYNLGCLLHNQQEYKSAHVYYERALLGYKKVLGLDHPTTLACLEDYSLLLKEMEKSSSISES